MSKHKIPCPQCGSTRLFAYRLEKNCPYCQKETGECCQVCCLLNVPPSPNLTTINEWLALSAENNWKLDAGTIRAIQINALEYATNVALRLNDEHDWPITRILKKKLSDICGE